jgi:hypothetical protein
VFPSVRIHTWGGLGSQLYALALSIDLEDKVFKRRKKFINHTGGTTKRRPEMSFYTENTKSVDDFDANDKQKTKNSSFKGIIKLYLKKLIFITGFYAECNDNGDMHAIKPWVIVIRGHYSHRQVSKESVTRIFQGIEENYFRVHDTKPDRAFTLHYRLGDLEVISEKSPIRLESIQGIINEITTDQPIQFLSLYSDTLDLAKQRLNSTNNKLIIKSEDKLPLEIIYECVVSHTFIGTNSKISFWIAICRSVFKSEGFTYLPLEIKHMIDYQKKLTVNHEIIYYQ